MRRADRYGGRIVLIAMPRIVRRTFEITGLDSVFEIYDTLAALPVEAKRYPA
jgi:anti-anti-sigma factor